MGTYGTATWEADPLAPSRQDRKGGTYHPYMPDPLLGANIVLSAEADRACERAARALDLHHGRNAHTTTSRSLSYVLLVLEALSSSRLSSSRFDDMGVDLRQLLELEALGELGIPHRPSPPEAEVLGNAEAICEALALGSRDARVTADDILSLHYAMLRDTKLDSFGGRLRTAQTWEGGSMYNPLGATFVPPRPQHVESLMEDLVEFVNDSSPSFPATAALAYAQFETIQPFCNANDRCGRALIQALLRKRGEPSDAVIPISLALLRLREQYHAALAAYRFDGNEPDAPTQAEAASRWVEFFCLAIVHACDLVRDIELTMSELREHWEGCLGLGATATERLLLDLLPYNPVVSFTSAARLTGRRYPRARAAVLALEDAGILFRSARNCSNGLFVANEVLGELARLG